MAGDGNDVAAAWQTVVDANQDAQQRLDASFERHGPLMANVFEMSALAGAGKLEPIYAATAQLLFQQYVDNFDNPMSDDLVTRFVADCALLVAALAVVS